MSAVRRIPLRKMDDSDLEAAVALSTEVRWPYRIEDWRFAFGLGRGIVAEYDGRVVATAMWWPYADTYATCGMIIVSPSMQGSGLGRALMADLMRDTSGRTILLNSTLEGLRLYQAFGFESVGTVHQHQARISPDAAASMPDVGEVRPAAPGDLGAILDFDRLASDAERRLLLTELYKVGAAAVIERKKSIHGFAMCRRFGLGHAIGPVAAKNADDAMALVRYFIRCRAGEFLRVDASGDGGLSPCLNAIGLPEVGSVTTMVRGRRPKPSAGAHLFALASQSLG